MENETKPTVEEQEASASEQKVSLNKEEAAASEQTPSANGTNTAANMAADLAKGAVKGAGGFMKEFKEFISRGNVLDMAVGVIVGGAFTAIVTSLVEDILTPIIGTILIGINFNDLGVRIPWGNHPYINFGSFIQAVITFLLTALCLFVILKAINIFKRKEEEKPAEPPKPSNEELLLTEIRDLLKQQAKNSDDK